MEIVLIILATIIGEDTDVIWVFLNDQESRFRTVLPTGIDLNTPKAEYNFCTLELLD